MTKIGYIKENSQKENIFKIHLPDNENYVVTLVPVEGNASLYVNPAFLPKQNDQFYYNALQEMVKRVIINEADLKGMGLAQPVENTNPRTSSSKFTANIRADLS